MQPAMNTLFSRITAPTGPAPRTEEAAPAPASLPTRPLTRVFVRDLVLDALVGIYDREKAQPQRLRINLDLGVLDRAADGRDCIADVVSYEEALNTITAIVTAGHINLLETLAETICRRLLEDGRVQTVTVRLEKLDAFASCASVGIEITRTRG